MKTPALSLVVASIFSVSALASSAIPETETPAPGWLSEVGQTIEGLEYSFATVSTDGWSAPNRTQNLRVTVSTTGLHLVPRLPNSNRQFSLGLRTCAIGRDGRQLPIGDKGWEAHGNRAQQQQTELLEWIENRPSGIEQGWTLHAPPFGGTDRNTSVWVELEITGDLSALPAADGRSITWVNSHGVAVLDYDGLRAWDASGRDLDTRFSPAPSGLRILVDDREAIYPVFIDPTFSDLGWDHQSDQDGAELGLSLSTAGDINGDGFSDIALSAPKFDGTHVNEGLVLVFHGTASGLSSTEDWAGSGSGASAQFGGSVSCAGDVNGDGYDDLLVGAPTYDNGQLNEGAAHLFYGSANGLASIPAWSFEANIAEARLGTSVARAGDVNGDGYDDLIIGAPMISFGQNSEGAVFVFHGSATGPRNLPDSFSEGNQAFSMYGLSVSGAGDTNADGYDDVLIGAPFYDGGQLDEGRASLFLGSSTGLGTSAAWTAEANFPGALVGHSVTGVGDVNGDGYADVGFGAPNWSSPQVNEGIAAVYLGGPNGPDSVPTWSVESNATNATFGYSIATAGDVNGDGYADVLVGAPQFPRATAGEGFFRLYLGSSAGLSPAHEFEMFSDQVDSSFGCSVASAGDVNGDGFGDVLVGARLFDDGQIDEGKVFLFFGRSRGLAASASLTLAIDQEGAAFGTSVNGAGDVNGDGFSDVIIGAPDFDGGQNDEGRAFVFHGSPSGMSPVPDWIGEANQELAGFGGAVDGAGDVNGDGYADVIISAPSYDSGHVNEGKTFVYHGSSTGLLSTPEWTAEGDQLEAEFGSCVAGAGDINGDGYHDVIVGAHLYDRGQIDEGVAFVYLGSPNGLNAIHSWSGESNQESAEYGYSVAGAGDVNGDGFCDIVLSAALYNGGQIGEGRSYAYYGSPAGLNAAPDWTAEIDQAFALFGAAVSGIGDVNGDGFSDVGIGAALYDNTLVNEGAVFVYHGSAAGLALDHSWFTSGDQPGSGFGYAVAAAGDVNGDGFGDLAVGARLFDDSQADEGAAYVFLGAGSGLSQSFDWRLKGVQWNAQLGNAVGCAGDVNGDGFDDLVTGAHFYDAGQSNEGLAFLHLGNGGGAPARAPQQRKGSGSSPIALRGASDQTDSYQIQIERIGNSPLPAGRCDVHIEWESKSVALPFDATDLRRGPSSIDSGSNGTGLVFNETVSGLNPGLHHWRARLATSNPHFPHGPWITISGNTRTEAKIRIPLVDCNGNGVLDTTDIANGTSLDCNANGRPDECDIAIGATQDCNANGIPDSCDIASGLNLDVNGNGVPDMCENEIRFCVSTPNSTGFPALIGSNSDYVIAHNNFVLTAAPVPNDTGLFFYSRGQTNGGIGIPFGNGTRCVGSPSDPIIRINPPITASGNVLAQVVDFNNLPPAGIILSGNTWNFQAWFRDPIAGGFSFDQSDAIQVTFQ
ncbi:MAG: hypothetical protein ACI841_004418 [Planctomycetota bacterium]|jgi:hypothetical protein